MNIKICSVKFQLFSLCFYMLIIKCIFNIYNCFLIHIRWATKYLYSFVSFMPVNWHCIVGRILDGQSSIIDTVLLGGYRTDSAALLTLYCWEDTGRTAQHYWHCIVGRIQDGQRSIIDTVLLGWYWTDSAALLTLYCWDDTGRTAQHYFAVDLALGTFTELASKQYCIAPRLLVRGQYND